MRRLRRTTLPLNHAGKGDPLQAVPHVATRVHIRTSGDGTLHLRREANPSRWGEAWLQKFFGWRRDRYINLDKRGTDFWHQVDGKRTLAAIAVRLSKSWKMELPECRKAVVVYTRALMIRNLVVLAVEDSERKTTP